MEEETAVGLRLSWQPGHAAGLRHYRLSYAAAGAPEETVGGGRRRGGGAAPGAADLLTLAPAEPGSRRPERRRPAAPAGGHGVPRPRHADLSPWRRSHRHTGGANA